MAQLGEAVAMVVADIKHDKDCYFCNAKKAPVEAENEFVENQPGDQFHFEGELPSGVKFKNDSGKLSSAIGGDQGTKRVTSKKLEVSVAAHHLIPGNASLANSDLFQCDKYLWKDGQAKGNIRYNINSSPNGIWLPGNYAQRPWGTGGVAFEDKHKMTAQTYAFKAMEAWKCQFHDAHPDYSTFVTSALDKIYDKLELTGNIQCPVSAKKNKEKEPKPGEVPPLYVLVGRLHTVSARMGKMLRYPISNWKRNVFTSRFAKQKMDAR